MLLLAHTWILREFLAQNAQVCRHPDIFIHNLSPDILTIHETINPATTHGIARFRSIPSPYKKAAFVQFHLLVDDMAHYGEITENLQGVFNPDSQGYCYLKGKALIEPIRNFYQCLGEEISYHNAVYQSHIIIEMAFDRMLRRRAGNNELGDFFLEAFKYTFDYKINEFSETQAWLFDIKKETIMEAVRQAWDACTSPLKGRFMSNEDHAGLYMEKFCLDGKDKTTRKGVVALLNQAEHLVPDYERFLVATIAAVKRTGFINPFANC